MISIIKNDWKMLIRKQAFINLNLFFLICLLIVVWIGNYQNKNQKQNQEFSQQKVREQWENLKPMNPHSAAHYGSYAFKPIGFLNSLDGGINDITGNVLKLEGHVQNEIVYSEASQSLSISKFGKLKSSILLQYVIPLILIILAFNIITDEKKHGRIKQLILQGPSLNNIIFAKSFSICAYGVLLMLITIIIQVINEPDLETIQRSILLICSYGSYYFIISSLSTYLSAVMKNNSSVLSTILAIWIMWTIFIPKIWGNTVEKIYPLPSRQTFNMAMKEERSKGIDGHNPYDKRREQLKNTFLAEYNVDSLSQLPINFDGIVMQADEEYGNYIWDKHFGNNYKILQNQKLLYQFSGIINPFTSLQNLSMGLCGSDMFYHLDFLKKAENYRRYLIKTLNDQHAYGGSQTGDWSWKVDSSFFKSINFFYYKMPKILNQINYYIIDILCLIIWIMLITIIIIITPKKNIIE